VIGIVREGVLPSLTCHLSVLTNLGETVRFAIGKNVVLNLEKLTSDNEESGRRMRSHALTDYKWENKSSYKGNILAVRGQLLAYRLFNDTTGEACILSWKCNRARILMKKKFRQFESFTVKRRPDI